MSLINALITLLTRLSTTEHDMHHIFDNISGHIMIGYRILIALIFIIGIMNTYHKSRAKVQNFVIYFAVLGGFYILALPIIILIGNNFI